MRRKTTQITDNQKKSKATKIRKKSKPMGLHAVKHIRETAGLDQEVMRRSQSKLGVIERIGMRGIILPNRSKTVRKRSMILLVTNRTILVSSSPFMFSVNLLLINNSLNVNLI